MFTIYLFSCLITILLNIFRWSFFKFLRKKWQKWQEKIYRNSFSICSTYSIAGTPIWNIYQLSYFAAYFTNLQVSERYAKLFASSTRRDSAITNLMMPVNICFTLGFASNSSFDISTAVIKYWKYPQKLKTSTTQTSRMVIDTKVIIHKLIVI